MEGAPSGDLQAKYQKLASEYSKIRSHVHVLKKGILDEQSKRTDLREHLKEKEKNLRKSELEIDSLNFRNQQLTKRITVLQDELDSIQLHKGAKKGKHKSDESASANSQGEISHTALLQEELQKKIIENAQLVSQMADKDFELSQLSMRMEDAERQLTEVETKYKCETVKLRSINQELQMALETASNGRDKITLLSQGTPSRHFAGLLNHNQISSINGDFLSEGGSLIGSEDALSTEELQINEQLSKKDQLLIKLEQENQTLKIECDLLRMEQEILKSDSNKSSSLTSHTNIHEQIDSDKQLAMSNVKDSDAHAATRLGILKSPAVNEEENVSKEIMLKTYFRDKISALVAEKQQCDSMNRHYMEESEALHSRLEYFQKEKIMTEQAMGSTQSTISRLEDELHSTSTNYEQQLSLLTEHVGNLNDKLTQQFEEIQHLKGQLGKRK